MALIRARSGRREVGDGPRAPQGGLSQNVEQKKGMDGWTEREKQRGWGASSLAELFLLRWVFRWGWLLCHKACCSD